MSQLEQIAESKKKFQEAYIKKYLENVSEGVSFEKDKLNKEKDEAREEADYYDEELEDEEEKPVDFDELSQKVETMKRNVAKFIHKKAVAKDPRLINKDLAQHLSSMMMKKNPKHKNVPQGKPPLSKVKNTRINLAPSRIIHEDLEDSVEMTQSVKEVSKSAERQIEEDYDEEDQEDLDAIINAKESCSDDDPKPLDEEGTEEEDEADLK